MRRLREKDDVIVRDGAELDGRKGLALLVGADAALVRLEGEISDRILPFSQLRRVVGMDEINRTDGEALAELNAATSRMLEAYRALEARLAPDAASVVRSMLGDLAQIGAMYANLPPALVPVARAVVDALAAKVVRLAESVLP